MSEAAAGPERLRERVAAFERRAVDPAGLRRAAVAVVVVELAPPESGPAFLLTRRAATLRAHAGQYALPGGALDAGERPVDAARRELAEELGLALPESAVLGLLDDYVTRSGYVMTPVVMAAGLLPDLRPDPAEVARVHVVPVAELGRAPRFPAVEGSPNPLIEVPLLGGVLHAPTAAVLHQFGELAVHGRTTRVAHLGSPRFAWR